MKLHLGCGLKYLEGYVHIDIMPNENVDFVSSIDNLSMIGDNSVEEIYACHVLEHVDRKNIEETLIEWRRVLKKGGRLRIAVPNFEAIVEEYMENKNLGSLLGLLYGGQDYEYNYHKIVFDFKKIKEILEKLNFKEIQKYNYQDFLSEEFDDFSKAFLPHMDRNGRLMSLNILAIKG